jgi:initiation factor 1A
MVKNSNGGNKAKKGAHKDTTVVRRVRLSESTEEIYGIASKILGGGKFHVKCNDDVIRLCVIGGKFSGKHKHANFIKAGTWVLVGLRTWETCIDKMPKCDLLECYSESDKDKLLQTTSSFTILQKEDNIINDLTEEEGNINIDDI